VKGLSLLTAVTGAIVMGVTLVVAPTRVVASYLVAYTFTLAIVLGVLLLVMIAHLSGAVWFVVLRRRAEAVLGALPLLAVLCIPILVVRRSSWVSARAVAYWAVWLVVGEALRRVSRRQDVDADPAISARLQTISAIGIPLTGVTLTFAAFDWMMALNPGWTSSVYGGYYFAGAMVSGVALMTLLASKVARTNDEPRPTAEHFQALGRLTLAFVLFWAYLWYAQFFIVWIADIPHEAAWYAVRLHNAWGAIGLSMLGAGLVVPFLVLVFHAARGSATVMRIVAFWLLAVHYIDIYWLLVPSMRPTWSAADVVWDAGALMLVAGGAYALALSRQTALPPVPIGDPQLALSAGYEAN
jgi:hypothetical protein